MRNARPGRPTITIQDFTVIKCIGEGGFSKVFLVKSRLDGEFYAMKLI
jgi:serine/threonine protein kinase